MPKRLLLLGLALWVSLALPPVARALGAGDYDRTLVFDGVERTYHFRVPAGYDGSEPIPLVLDIHGLGSNGGQQKLISGIAAEADAAGFAAVWPDGTDHSWNAGDCCGMALANQVDDVGFLRTLVAAMRAEVSIQPDRIYVTGLSNGGAMTQVLACRAADLFAAAAPMSFPIPYHPLSTCAPSRAIPVLTFQGLSDNLVPYAGNGFVAPAADSFAQWRTNDGCGTDPSEEIDDFGMSSCEIDTSCAGGAQAGLCSIASTFAIVGTVGHVIYSNDDDLALSDVAWEFFSRFTLPGDPEPLALPPLAKRSVSMPCAGSSSV